MKTKLALLTGAAIGYVLGTRDGRQRFEQIKGAARSAWSDPRVQDTVETVKDQAAEGATTAAGKAKQAVADRVAGGRDAS